MAWSNTSVGYTYRDASNYQQRNRVVFAGRPTDDELAALLGNRHEGRWIIPSQVGLPDLQEWWGGRFYEDDHVWHELEPEDIEGTNAAPTEVEDIHAFAARVAAASWDADAAARELGLPCAADD